MFDEELITWSVDGGGKLFHRPRHKFSVTNVSGWLRLLDQNTLDYRFLFYVLYHQWSQLDFDYVAKAHPSVIRDIYKVPVPPLGLQKQIVAELDGFSSILDGVQTILNNWRPKLVSHSDWPLMTLGDVAKWTSGGTPKAGAAEFYGGDIPWAVIGDLTEGVVESTEKQLTVAGLRGSSAKVMPTETVFLAMYGASIGRTGISAKPMATNQAIACAVTNRDIMDPWFLLYYLQSQKEAFIGAGTGGAQPNISQGIVKAWPIPVPPILEQREILRQINEEKAQVEGLASLRAVYIERMNSAIQNLWADPEPRP
jgi:restriction endonuclease S subunit